MRSRHLEDSFDAQQVFMEYGQPGDVFVDWQVVSALQEWTTAGSQILCIVGPNQVAEPSTTSLVAAEFILSVTQSQIPIVSYFCQASRETLHDETTRECEAIIALTYALIR